MISAMNSTAFMMLFLWMLSTSDGCLPNGVSGGGGCCRRGGGGCCGGAGGSSCCPTQVQVQVSCANAGCAGCQGGGCAPPDAIAQYQPPPVPQHPVQYQQPMVQYVQQPQVLQPMAPYEIPEPQRPIPQDYQAQPPEQVQNAHLQSYQANSNSLTDDSMTFPIGQEPQPAPFVQEPAPQPSQDQSYSNLGPAETLPPLMELPPQTLPPAPPLLSSSYPPPLESIPPVDYMKELTASSAEPPPENPPVFPAYSSPQPPAPQPNEVDLASIPATAPKQGENTSGDDYDAKPNVAREETRSYSISEAPYGTTLLPNYVTESYGVEQQRVESGSDGSGSYTAIEQSGYRHSSSSSFYNTYHDQVCSGETILRSTEKSLRKALKKCKALGCVAANVEPISVGIQVDFLKKVDKRVNDGKRHCLSRYDVPLFTNNSWQMEKEMHFSNTAEGSRSSEPKSPSYLRRRPQPSKIFRPQRARFVTTEPKSPY